MSAKFTASFDFSKNDIVKQLELEEYGMAQIYVDESVLTLCEPYVPFREGKLMSSGSEFTEVGSGKVRWRTPYARRMYYHPEYNFNGAPMRGAFWFDRAMQEGGKEKILKGLAKLIKARAKK